MEKLTMQSHDVIGSNTQKIAELFPHCVTERKGKDGKPELAIDFEKLQAELGNELIGESEERYQFTWPDKREAIRLANTPTTMTLRPCREESVDFENTQNLYIEGDNLDVLKVLRETYLGKVKMIYIDPPYNTGNDFVYNDSRKEGLSSFENHNGLYDEDGMIQLQGYERNTESNGRFHTDWLNMIYPRLKVARDLLTEDGVVFISIDDNEIENMRRVCNEIFGAFNFRNTILTRRRIKSLNSQFADNGLQTLNVGFEYILVYTKSRDFLMNALRQKKNVVQTEGQWQGFWSNADRPTMRYEVLGFTPTTGQWRSSKEKADIAVENYRKYQDEFADKMTIEEYSSKTGITSFIKRDITGKGKNGGVYHWVPPQDTTLKTSNWTDIEVSQIIKEIDLPFDNPKNRILIAELIKLSEFTKTDLILDFFSGSATTAHAVMKLNAEDGGNRKFIMVQLPEKTDEKSEAYKAGYKNICEIGKERIRRAGKKVKEEAGLQGQNLDTGFRVLKLDSSNMEDVYYTPGEFSMGSLFAENVKADRTSEDLLFQVMLDLGIELSAQIETKQINGKSVHLVDENYLIACFDHDVNESAIIEIAKRQPVYFVMRDASAASDNVIDNFEQIFRHYSPDTTCRVI